MSATSPRPSYAAVLRIPYARRTFAAVLVGRLPHGMVPVAVLLAVTRTTGAYAVAGTVMALFGATSVFLSPVRAGLVDRYGPRRALLPMASLYAVLLGAPAVASWRPAASGPVLGRSRRRGPVRHRSGRQCGRCGVNSPWTRGCCGVRTASTG